MKKVVIGSKYVAPQPRSYERRGLDGSYSSFMEFPSGSNAERLQTALLRGRPPTLLEYLRGMFA